MNNKEMYDRQMETIIKYVLVRMQGCSGSATFGRCHLARKCATSELRSFIVIAV